MQIFEVVELLDFPYMETREVVQGQIVGDILNDASIDKVYLLVDHDTKRIWAYNGLKSSFKIQIYGGILAGKLRQQMRLFYRVYPLNLYSKEDPEFQKLLERQIGGGRAKPIEKKDFPEPTPDKYAENISVSNPNINKAFEYINQFPHPDELIKRFTIIGGTIFTDEEVTESFLKEEKTVLKPVKLGRLNNGFTFFQDHNYSTRVIIKERNIQGIELYINKDDKSPTFKIEIPVIQEDKFRKPGSMKDLIKAFQIPKKIIEEKDKEKEEENEKDIQNDSTD
ncbi:MAG: hypothetical protein JSV62_06890 [Promethearchaeota archaeon]|nr:MAG: hypothetical protein JSV62_06890 [Candidatus Lokiarchaeota archaeon]